MKPHGPDQPDLDTSWMAEAPCARVPGLPWIDNPHQVPRVLLDVMREICESCPVLDRCAAFVDEAEICAGWWAGASQCHRGVNGQRPSRIAPRRAA